jgi:transcriptional regulator with XRE-family HTH domain
MRQVAPLEGVLQGLGARLAQSRRGLGLTQEEAAAKAGMDLKRWQRLEAGAVNATVRTLVHAAQAIGVDFWDLVGGSAPPASPRRPGRPTKANE